MYRIFKGIEVYELRSLLRNLSYSKLILLGIAMMLLIPNWLLETYKLKWVLMQQSKSAPFFTCLKGVLTGVTLGIVTPARLGEYAGRMMAFSKERRTMIAGATMVTSLCQMAVTLFIGALCALALFRDYQYLEQGWVWMGVILSFASIILGLLYWPALLRSLDNFSIIKTKLNGSFVPNISRLGMTRVLGLSCLRYFVYTIQFLLVLMAIGVETPPGYLLLHLPLIFFLQTLLPLPPITSFVGRASVAVVVLSQLGLSDLYILTASSMIWVINLVIPAFLGLGLIWWLSFSR